MNRLIACAAILGAQIAGAREANVADHGIVPGKDVTYALNRLIERRHHS